MTEDSATVKTPNILKCTTVYQTLLSDYFNNHRSHIVYIPTFCGLWGHKMCAHPEDVRISATCTEDVIIQASVEPHSESWNWFTQTALVCLGRNSLGRYCQVSSGQLLFIHETFEYFPVDEKCHNGWSRAHGQYPLSKFHPKQTRAVCVNWFHLLLWASIASLYDYIIHVALIATHAIHHR